MKRLLKKEDHAKDGMRFSRLGLVREAGKNQDKLNSKKNKD
jgi:hypothetical protein